jgi:hypothetical protein
MSREPRAMATHLFPYFGKASNVKLSKNYPHRLQTKKTAEAVLIHYFSTNKI